MRLKRKADIKTVHIHVRGGVAYCGRPPKGVRVVITDHDNREEEDKGPRTWTHVYK